MIYEKEKSLTQRTYWKVFWCWKMNKVAKQESSKLENCVYKIRMMPSRVAYHRLLLFKSVEDKSSAGKHSWIHQIADIFTGGSCQHHTHTSSAASWRLLRTFEALSCRTNRNYMATPLGAKGMLASPLKLLGGLPPPPPPPAPTLPTPMNYYSWPSDFVLILKTTWRTSMIA